MSDFTPEQEFAAIVARTARKQLEQTLGTEAGKKAAQTVTMSFLSAMRMSKDKSDWLKVTEASIATCVATSADTQLFPGGPYPKVYLVPQPVRRGEAPELQWRINHRGLSELYSRAGINVMAVPVGKKDHLKIAYGEACEHESDPTWWPSGKDDMVGVILVVRRIADGLIISRAWCPLAVIEARRLVSRQKDGTFWSDWYVEMAQKTAILWGHSRGYIPTDSPELRAAMEADLHGEALDVPYQPKRTEGPTGDAAIGLQRTEPKLLAEDIGNGLAEEEDNRKPELVVVSTTTTEESPL